MEGGGREAGGREEGAVKGERVEWSREEQSIGNRDCLLPTCLLLATSCHFPGVYSLPNGMALVKLGANIRTAPKTISTPT